MPNGSENCPGYFPPWPPGSKWINSLQVPKPSGDHGTVIADQSMTITLHDSSSSSVDASAIIDMALGFDDSIEAAANQVKEVKKDLSGIAGQGQQAVKALEALSQAPPLPAGKRRERGMIVEDIKWVWLKQRAEKAQKEEIAAIKKLGHDWATTERLINERVDSELVKLFLFAGMDVKGRFNLTSRATGKSLAATATFIPPTLAVDIKVQAKAEAARLDRQCLVVFRAASQLDAGFSRYEVNRPITLLMLTGSLWQVKLEAGAQAKIGGTLNLSLTPQKGLELKDDAQKAEPEEDQDLQEMAAEEKDLQRQDEEDSWDALSQTIEQSANVPGKETLKTAVAAGKNLTAPGQSADLASEINAYTGDKLKAYQEQRQQIKDKFDTAYSAVGQTWNSGATMEQIQEKVRDAVNERAARTIQKAEGKVREAADKVTTAYRRLPQHIEKELRDAADRAAKFEFAAAQLEAQASAEINLSYGYETYLASDLKPIYMSDAGARSELRNEILKVLKADSPAQLLMDEGLSVIEAHSKCCFTGEGDQPETFKRVSSLKQLLAEISFGLYKPDQRQPSDFLDYLKDLKGGGKFSRLHKGGEKWLDALRQELTLCAKPGAVSGLEIGNFVRVAAHAPSAKANAYAGLGLQLKVAGEDVASASAKAKLDLAGGYRWSTSRFQLKSPALRFMLDTSARDTPLSPDSLPSPADVFMTYDTRIRYSQFVFDAGVSASARTDLAGGASRQGKDKVRVQPMRLNRMRYECAVAVWTRPGDGKLSLLPTTGVAFGESFVAKNLRRLYKHRRSNPQLREAIHQDPYFRMIAAQLQLKPHELIQFLSDPLVKLVLFSPSILHGNGSTFLEATFALTNPSALVLSCTKRPVENRFSAFMNLFNDAFDTHSATIIEPEEAMAEKLMTAPRALESVSLRYRLRDQNRQDEQLFKLGIGALIKRVTGKDVATNDVEITLKKVDEAGSDAMIELATVFFNKKLQSPDGLANYEKAVPPAVLFGL